MTDMQLVALEGVDGSGKSTVAPLVAAELARRGFECQAVGEFGSPVGDLLLEMLTIGLSPYQKTLFFALDRSLMLDRMRSETDYGNPKELVVLWDRYALSAFVCRQMEIATGIARPELAAVVDAVNDSFPPPDLVVFFDLPVEVCAKRVVERGFPSGDYDHHVDRLTLMRTMYLERLPDHHFVIDALLSPHESAMLIADGIEHRLGSVE